MKIVNVGNKNYSNQKPHNFGMKLDFDEAAIKLLHREFFDDTREFFKYHRLKNGKRLTIKGTGVGERIVLEVMGRDATYNVSNVQGLNSFDCNRRTLNGKLRYALTKINEMFYYEGTKQRRERKPRVWVKI